MTLRNTLALSAASLALAGGGLLLAQGDHEYVVRAEFRNAAGLHKNDEVRMQGAPAGKVRSLSLGKGDIAVAELAVDRSAAPVGRDARAAVRSANLLGGKYVDLDPGDARDPAPSGFTIVARRTAAPVELDDLLSVLHPDTRMRLRILIEEGGVALDGRGADFNRLLAQLPPSLDRNRAFIAALGADNAALRRLIEESDALLASAAPQRAALGRLVTSADAALGAAASRRAALGETIEQAPGALTQLRATLMRLANAARPLRPAARALRRSAQPLAAVLTGLPGLVPEARRTLATARRVAPQLTTLVNVGLPLAHELRPTAATLDAFAQSSDGASQILDRGVGDLLGTIEGWARATRVRDAASHMFRNRAQLSSALATALIDRYVRPPARRRHLEPVNVPMLKRDVPRAPAPAPPTPVSKLLEFLLR